MSRDERIRWDDRYQTDDRWRVDHVPFPWLVEHTPPTQDGLALDIACGLGHNALWLAVQGYRVLGVDISLVALKRALKSARYQNLDGRAVFAQVDMDHFRPPHASFDLICVVRFLSRDLFPTIISALKPGGLLLYATLNWRYGELSPETPQVYLLSPGELEQAFAALEIIEACERGDMSFLIARKPLG
jgi:tellurite methyltransferase